MQSDDGNPSSGMALITSSRLAFHKAILDRVLSMHGEIPSNADKDSLTSVALAQGIAERVGSAVQGRRLAGQIAGARFENICAAFLSQTFGQLSHLRPGEWLVETATGPLGIAKFEQYAHLQKLHAVTREDGALAAALGRDYIIRPDVVVVRVLPSDAVINAARPVVDAEFGVLADLRSRPGALNLLHASVSCKWTIRSDRVQNARTEALNLIRNRKGRLPHVVVVTGDPLPSRLAAIALGTGDVDCVYHFALPELLDAALDLDHTESLRLLRMMVDGRRLKDIADLPLDLAV